MNCKLINNTPFDIKLCHSDVEGTHYLSLTIDGKKVQSYNSDIYCNHREVEFVDSESIELSMYEDYKKPPGIIKLIETDGITKEKIIGYIDFGDKYCWMSTNPMKEITKEEAKLKITDLDPDFRPTYAAYNDYGVGIFGFCGNERKYGLYWAFPQDDKAKKVTGHGDIFRDGGSSEFRSKDVSVVWHFYFKRQLFTINYVPAEPIDV